MRKLPAGSDCPQNKITRTHEFNGGPILANDGKTYLACSKCGAWVEHPKRR